MQTQDQSPLFKSLPAELRNRIFALSITPHTEKQLLFPPDAYYYRPNFRYLNTSLSVSLLQTCKRIYEETRHLPLDNHVHVAWFHRGPSKYPSYEYFSPEPSLSELSVHSDDSVNSEGIYATEVLEMVKHPSYVQPSSEIGSHADDLSDTMDLASEDADPASELEGNRPSSPTPSTNSISTDLSYFSGSEPEEFPMVENVPYRRPWALHDVSTPRPYPPNLLHLHLFTQQYWLYDWPTMSTDAPKGHDEPRSRDYFGTRRMLDFYSPGGLQRKAKYLKTLKLTLRHSDWFWWEEGTELILDAKQAGNPSRPFKGKRTDAFADESWGTVFSKLPNTLQTFEFELETIAGKKDELDDIVERAFTWEFPLPDGEDGGQRALIVRKEKTLRKGWWGERLRDVGFGHWEGDPVVARASLEADGVDFRVEDGEDEILTDDRMTYYVVTVRYEARDILNECTWRKH